MQSGQTDCSLFAIAFVTAFSYGLHPGAYIYTTEQNLMRSHLLKCFENGMFPVRKTRRVAEKVKRLKNSMCIAPAGCQ